MRHFRPKGKPKQTLGMVGIGMIMMIIIDLFVMGDIRYLLSPAALQDTPWQSVEIVPSYVPVEEFFNLPPEAVDVSVDNIVEDAFEPEPEAFVDILEWQNYAAAFEPAAGALDKIIIIIDDMGLSQKYGEQILDLPAPLTLAYLPYAKDLKTQTKTAHKAGHELMIHTPMEPMSREQDPGPMALLDDMSLEVVDEVLDQIFSSFDGYIGINNHMGSLLTQNEDIMRRVMQALKARGLVFIDSKTSAKSVAAHIAQEEGIYYAQRDVFLDHHSTPEFVAGALKKLEERAHKKGYAIAIGHPKSVTIDALRAWIPTLKDKGLELAPVSYVLSAPRPLAQR